VTFLPEAVIASAALVRRGNCNRGTPAIVQSGIRQL
jgi:hypothetical protein